MEKFRKGWRDRYTKKNFLSSIEVGSCRQKAGEALKRWRTSHNMNEVEAACLLGLPYAAYWAYERNKRPCHAAVLVAANALQTCWQYENILRAMLERTGMTQTEYAALIASVVRPAAPSSDTTV